MCLTTIYELYNLYTQGELKLSDNEENALIIEFENNKNDICDCTTPQVDEDKMCICGLPIIIEDNWTNDSGYSDVFH